MRKGSERLALAEVRGHERAKSSGIQANLDDRTREFSTVVDDTYYAFTSAVYHPRLNKLFCGTTNKHNDLLQSFDLETGEFESMGYADFAEPFEIKIHRSSCVGQDGNIYAATSALHDINKRPQAPGGRVFRFNPNTREYTLLTIPCKHDYIQTISLNWKRQIICGMSYPVFNFFAYDMRQDKVVYEQYMGSIAHIGAFDDKDGYWGTWGDRHCLFRYDPSSNAVQYFDHGFPVPCHSLMYKNAGPIDCMINGRDGYLYVGHESGELYRLDPRNGELTYLLKPLPGQRLPALAIGEDGRIYGAGGNDDSVHAFAYDRAGGRCEVSERLADSTTDEPCFRAHDMVTVGKRLFLCETDTQRRASYLWELRLP